MIVNFSLNVRRRFFGLATVAKKNSVVNVVKGYPPVKLHYLQEYFKQGLEQVTKDYQSLEKIGMTKRDISRLIATRPELFKSEETGSTLLGYAELPIEERLNNIRANQGSAWLHAVSSNDQLLDQKQVLADSKNILKEELGLSDIQIERIIKYFPRTINRNLRSIAYEKRNILQDYFHLTNEEIADLMFHIPFLINMKTHTMRQFLQFMANHNFTKAELILMVKEYPELLAVDRKRLDKLYNLPLSWGVSEDKVKKTILEHPKYLLVCPFELMPLKIKLFKHFKISQTIAKYIFEEYPTALILSVSSLEAKLIYLHDRMKISFESPSELFPYALTLNYNALLRPRGELIVKHGLDMTRQQFEISDEKFCQQNNMNPEVLVAQKSKYPITAELDYRRKFFSPTVHRMRKDGSLKSSTSQIGSELPKSQINK